MLAPGDEIIIPTLEQLAPYKMRTAGRKYWVGVSRLWTYRYVGSGLEPC